MKPFRKHIKNYLEKLKNYEIEIIGPSHRPVHDRPELIVNFYNEWVSESIKNCVVIPYISMHGSISKAIDYFVKKLIKKGIETRSFNLTVRDVGELAISLVDCATVVIRIPTVLGGSHPHVFYILYIFKILRPKTKFISLIGSFLWGTNILKYMKDSVKGINVKVIEPVIFKGSTKDEDFEKN